jgi:hypothetical protein
MAAVDMSLLIQTKNILFHSVGMHDMDMNDMSVRSIGIAQHAHALREWGKHGHAKPMGMPSWSVQWLDVSSAIKY